MNKKVFKGFLMGGFECSTHRNYKGKRIDVIAGTRHDEFAEADYARLMSAEMKTARDGVRWHLIEREPYKYDFSSITNQVRAAKQTGIQIIWDLFHYGYPEDLDIFSPEFPIRFAGFAEAFTKFLLSENSETPFFCPVNEISFFSWIAGDVGMFFPFERGRGDELKRQLIRSSIAAIDKIRAVCPNARFVQTDPAIRVTVSPKFPNARRDAENYHQSQFHAIDMLIGKRAPELGGSEKYLDIIGLNYYYNNQWRHPSGRRILRGNKDYKPFNQILSEWFARYRRPVLIAETGIEDEARPDWFRYISEEVRAAQSNDILIEGICLYPVINHPGWDDNRHCYNGLWDYPDEAGQREIYQPFAEEIEKQKEEQKEFETLENNRHPAKSAGNRLQLI